MVSLADHGRRLRHVYVAPPCVVILDIVIVILLAASIAYDFLAAYSHFEKPLGRPAPPIIGTHFYLIYTML